MSVAVGADIESLCNKCGDVWHVVVAKVGDKIAKVQCKECGAYHRHKAPGGAKSARTTKSTGTRRTTKAAAAPRIDQPQVEPDLSKPARKYSIRETFEIGERVEHPTFGTGVVELIPEVGKIQVFFPDGRRVLAQAKPVSRLEKPRPFVHDAES